MKVYSLDPAHFFLGAEFELGSKAYYNQSNPGSVNRYRYAIVLRERHQRHW